MVSRSLLAASLLVALLPGCPVSTTATDDTGALDAGLDASDHDAAAPPDAWSTPDATQPCPTPGAIEHLPCGHCGTLDRFCTATNTWSYGTCMGEHGTCNPGDSEVGACGRCGQQARFCDATCAWIPMGACLNETGSCVPGTRMRVATGCPAGQSRIDACDATCAVTHGPCEMLECDPGMLSAPVSCGRCGTMVRSCDATGHWMDGTCAGEGECAPGATSSVTCEVCGTQPSTCDATCHWMATGVCTGGVTCGARPAASCVDATTLRTYDGAPGCMTGACVYPPMDVTCPAGCAANACVGGATLVAGLGGATGFGTATLPSTDDGSSTALDLTMLDPMGLFYYGARRATLFVNNNGNVTFGAAQPGYSPMIPGAMAPMIAPFWADVDTGGGGQPARNNVVWSLDTTRLVVTWDHVGRYMRHDDLQNSFQLIVTPRPDRTSGDFDVELRYALCQWTRGDTSATPATAGFDAGDSTRSLVLPGSGTPAVLSLCTTSNVGTAGVWRYEVRAGMPVSL